MSKIIIPGVDIYGQKTQEIISVEQQGLFVSRNQYKTLGAQPGLAVVVVQHSWLRKLYLRFFGRKWKTIERIQCHENPNI